LNFMDVDDEEIARQLTLIEWEYFLKIKPSEFQGLSWCKPSQHHRSPNVLAMITRFNQISLWVAHTILKFDMAKLRGKMMMKFINIAKHLRVLSNFADLMAFIAGLNNSAILRLKQTRKELSKKSVDNLEELELLMRSTASYKNYREALRLLNTSCIPYIGLALSDLTFIEEGNPDTIDGLINFGKRELICGVILSLQQCQNTPYNLSIVPKIADMLANFPSRTEQECYDLSLQRETRNQSVRGISSSPSLEKKN